MSTMMQSLQRMTGEASSAPGLEASKEKIPRRLENLASDSALFTTSQVDHYSCQFIMVYPPRLPLDLVWWDPQHDGPPAHVQHQGGEKVEHAGPQEHRFLGHQGRSKQTLEGDIFIIKSRHQSFSITGNLETSEPS